MSSYLIYGAGGHARVVADAVVSAGGAVAAFIDDHAAAATIEQVPVIAHVSPAHSGLPLVIGIGNNSIRKQIAERWSHTFGTIVHPTAVIAAGVTIGEGTVVLANTVIQAGAVIGRHVIINAHVCIDHDAVIGDYAHIYPLSYIGGGSSVAEGITVNPGTFILRNTVVDTDR